MKSKKRFRYRLLDASSYILSALAILILLASLLMNNPTIQEWYETFQQQLTNFEYAVASIPYRWLIPFIIILLFLIKLFFPMLPLSAICFISGMVFNVSGAVALNLFGYGLLLSVKYWYGRSRGGGNIHNILRRHKTVRTVLESGGRGNPFLLFIFRIVPGLPQNSVSQVYGAMEYPYGKFLSISLAGFFPRLVSYTVIGRNVYRPLSVAFIMPIVILLLLSGFSVFVFSRLLQVIEKSRLKLQKGETTVTKELHDEMHNKKGMLKIGHKEKT